MTMTRSVPLPSFHLILAVLASLLALPGLSAAQLPPEPVWVTVPASAGPSGFASQVVSAAAATDGLGQTVVVGTYRGRVAFGTNTLADYGSDAGDNIFVVKHDAAGRILWARRAGGNGSDSAKSVAISPDGTIYVAGETTSAPAVFGTNQVSTFGSTFYLASYSPEGECRWVRRAGPWLTSTPAIQSLSQVAAVNAGGLGVNASGQIYVGGTFVAIPQFGGVATNNFLPYNLSGGVLLTNSSTNFSAITSDLFLAKYEADGALLWVRGHGGTNQESLNSMALDAAGSAYVAGAFLKATEFGANTFTNIPNEPGPFVAKFDSLGAHVWSTSLGAATNNRSASAHSIAVTPGGEATVLFQSKTSPYRIGSLSVTNLETDPGNTPVTMNLLARLDAAGNAVWLKKTPFHATGFGVIVSAATLTQDSQTNTYVGGNGYWNLSAAANAPRGLAIAKYDAAGDGLWTNLVSRSAPFGNNVFGQRLLTVDPAQNTWFAATFRGEATTSVPVGWTNVVNAFTNGFGNNVFLTKLTNFYHAVVPEFVHAPTNMVFQPPRGLTNSALARAWPVADYRWFMNSNGVTTRIGTNQLLTLASSTVTNVTTYYVVASNLVGLSTSTVVFAQPLLAILPVTNATNAILLGGSGTLSVNSTGTTAISYQWRFNGTNFAGATGATLVLNNVATNASGLYTVVACNDWGCVTSAPPITVKVVPPGSLEGSYATQLTGDAAMVRLADGRLLVVGNDTAYSGASQLHRVLTNGVADTNFYLKPAGLGGTYAWWRTGAFDQQGPRALVVEPDGRIVVGGNFTRFFTNYPSGNWATVGKMVRLTSEGVLDPGFNAGTGPTDPFDAGNSQAGIRALVRQADGKLIAAGWFRSFNGVGRTNVVRLNIDGSIDGSFAGQAFAYGTDYNNVGQANALALQPDGKVLVGGNWQRISGVDRPVLMRLNTDGSIDASFSVMRRKDGSSTWPANGFCVVQSIALLPSGKILIAGNGLRFNQTGYDNNAIFQLNADGTVDTNFVAIATGGMTSSSIVAVQPDGKILLGGSPTVNRFLATGAADPDWKFDPSLVSPVTSQIMVEPGGYTALMAGSYGIKRILLTVDTGAVTPPNFPTGSAIRLPNGEFGFTTCGQTGQTLVIQGSTNLTDWVSLQTNVISSGCVDFIDTQAPLIPNRYFRVLVPQ